MSVQKTGLRAEVEQLSYRVYLAAFLAQTAKKDVKTFLAKLPDDVKVKLMTQSKDYIISVDKIARGYWKDITSSRLLRILDKIKEVS